MKEFHLTMQLRNNLLRQRRVELGLNQHEMAMAIGIQPGTYGLYETLRLNPLCRGGWRRSARAIADYFKVCPEDLWPDAVLAVEEVQASRELDAGEMAALVSSHEERRRLTPDSQYEDKEQLAAIETILSKLSPRQQEVIASRYGLSDHEVEDRLTLAKRLGITRSRVATIEECALVRIRLRALRLEGGRRRGD